MPPTLPEPAPNTIGPESPFGWQLMTLTGLTANEEDPPRIRLNPNGQITLAGWATASENITAGSLMLTIGSPGANARSVGKLVRFLSNNVGNVLTFGLVEAGKQTLKPLTEVKAGQVVSFEGTSWSLN